MKSRLLWKLLAVNLAVIAFVVIVVWFAIDMLAAGYFVTLMQKYHISPEPAHAMFVGAIHRYLLWACLAAVLLAALLSFAMMRQVLKPLMRMTLTTGEIAAGNFGVRVPVHSRDEVGRLARAFNQMAESLQKLDTLRRDLMIDVAHELRTPLTNMRGYLEALGDEVLPPSKETFDLLQSETLRLTQLVEDVLRLARADAARGRLSFTQIDLSAAAHAALEPFRGGFKAKSISISLTPDDRPVFAMADAGRIGRVLRNLVDNAVRYTPPGGRLRIDFQEHTDRVHVDFSNDAENVTARDLPFLFERFYRAEKSRSREHGGAGIGLAVVKELIEAHGGAVSAELNAGRLHIRFTLPRGPAASGAAPAAPQS